MTQDGSDLIHFCADNQASPDLIHLLYEIGIRMGRRFIVHRTPTTIPSDGSIIVTTGANPWERSEGKVVLMLDPPAPLSNPLSHYLKSLQTTRELLGCAHHLLSFKHENHGAPDWLGRVKPENNALVAGGVVEQPWLERIAAEVWRRLELAGAPPLPRTFAWPTDRVTLCMTHDVDGPQLFSRFATMRSGILGFLRGNRFERESFLLSLLLRAEGMYDPYLNFEAWREYESLHGGISTFFVYPGKLSSVSRHRKDPKYDPAADVLRKEIGRLADAGWEIGVHHPILSRSEAGYAESRQRLNDLFPTPVSGGRGHYWMMDWQDPYRSWRAMRDANYAYDMTLSPMALGFRAGSLMPFSPGIRWGEDDPCAFFAIPTAVMDAYAVPRETGLRLNGINGTLGSLLKDSRDHGFPLVLDWHERTFINRGAWTGYLRPLVHILQESRELGGFSIVSARQLADCWKSYVKVTFGGLV